MTTEQNQVREFMLLAGQLCPKAPILPLDSIRELRIKLIQEELDELRASLSSSDMLQTYDALLDLLYVVIGSAVAFGMELEPGWQEVHRSNMSKMIDGHKRDDGKWIKGKSYSPPKLEAIILAQSQTP